MRYLILLYGDEAAERALALDERRAIVERHLELSRRLRETGALVEGAPLESRESARILRRRDGRAVVTDGPFPETKEQLGGFYLLECADVEEALDWARQVPESPGLVVEVRPVAPV
jgi:hypothetical protein